jgi:transcriptional regulator with XRE-family HTH domain
MVYKLRWTVGQRGRFIARWVKFREEQGLTQGQLAEAMGISVREVQRIERGAFVPRNVTVLKFAEVERKYRAGAEVERSLAWPPGDAESI